MTRALDAQIAAYLAQNGGQADPDALFSVQSGGNSLIANAQAVENGTKTVVQAQNDIRAAANLAPTLINNLATAGARHILVFNLNDYADVPGAPSGVIVHAFIRAEVENFNRIGLQKLKETGRNSFIVERFCLRLHQHDGQGVHGSGGTARRPRYLLHRIHPAGRHQRQRLPLGWRPAPVGNRAYRAGAIRPVGAVGTRPVRLSRRRLVDHGRD
ncbi:MAG: hypothetical protein VW644_04995, partial [Alphaproteobacteria bacterium]